MDLVIYNAQIIEEDILISHTCGTLYIYLQMSFTIQVIMVLLNCFWTCILFPIV